MCKVWRLESGKVAEGGDLRPEGARTKGREGRGGSVVQWFSSCPRLRLTLFALGLSAVSVGRRGDLSRPPRRTSVRKASAQWFSGRRWQGQEGVAGSEINCGAQ